MKDKKTTGRALKERRKQEKEAAEKKEKDILKKIFSVKHILVFICAVILALIIALIIVKAIVPAVRKASAESKVADNKNVTYEVTSYKNGVISTELYDIIIAAEKDSESAVRNYGAAISIGEYTISVPEMEIAYFDTFNSLYSNAVNYNNSTDGKAIDFPYYQLPEDYEYGEDVTWADYILTEAGTELRDTYYLFDEALSDGFVPTDDQLSQIKDYYSTIDSYVDEGETADSVLEGIYCNGVTYNLYARRCIMRMYVNLYEEYTEDKIAESVTQDDVNAFFGDEAHTAENYALSKFTSDYLPEDDEYVISENTNNLEAVPGLADDSISEKLGLDTTES